MPKIVKLRRPDPPNLLGRFTAHDITPALGKETSVAESLVYSASSDLRLWARFDKTSPTDLANYDSTNPPVLGYEGGSKTAVQTVYSSNMKTAEFISGSDALATRNAVASYSGVDNPLSFGNGTAASQQSFSISLWFKKNKPQVTELTDNYFFAKGLVKSSATYDNSEYGALLQRADDKLVFYLADASSQSLQFIESSAGTGLMTSFDTWHHIAFTYDGTPGDNSNTNTANAGLKIYLDGALHSTVLGKVHAGSGYLGMERKSQRIYIGSNDGSVSGDANLIMAEMAVWQKELSLKEIKAIYNWTYQSSVVKSGYTNLPPRITLRTQDNRPGYYPTHHRMGDKDRSGKQNIFYEDMPISFGGKVEDTFDNIPENKFIAKNTHFRPDKWVVSSGMTIKREVRRQSGGEIVNDSCAVFSGKEERFLRTKNKIRNPTFVYIELLQGPYNKGPNRLNLSRPDRTQTLKIEISIDASFSTPRLIKTFTPEVNLQNFYGLLDQNSIDKPISKKVYLGLSDFPDLGAPYYLRIVQSTFKKDRATWAIREIKIEYANQKINYPLLLSHKDDIGNKIALSKIANPHASGSLKSVGRSLKGASDLVSPFQDFSESITPFNEFLAVETAEDAIFTQGLDPNVYPGFTSPGRDKTKITIDLGTRSSEKFGYIDAIKGTASSFGSDTSGVGQQLMVFYNKDLSRWEKIGQPAHINNVSSATAQTAAHMLSSSCIGFGPLTDVFSKGTVSSTGVQRNNDISNIYDRKFLELSCKKITDFNFPYGQQYFATSSHIVKAKDLGITKPFLLENVSFSFSASFGFGGDNGLNRYGHMFALKMLDRTNTSISAMFAGGIELIVPTFFILRQYKHTTAGPRKQNVSANTNTIGTGFRASTTHQIPTIAYLSGTKESETLVDTSRELITYGQLGLFTTGGIATSGAPSNDRLFRSNGSPIFPQDVIDSGLSFDENRVHEFSAQPTINGRRTLGMMGNFTVNFPSRISTTFSADNSPLTYGLSSITSPYTDVLRLSNLFAYNDSEVENSRRIVNGQSSQKRSGAREFFPDHATGSRAPVSIEAPEESEKISPYLILPEDELIIGAQYPVAANPGHHAPGKNDDSNYPHRMFSMQFHEDAKMHLYGSQVVENKQFHETTNQNLNSSAVYEHIIGNDKIIDQWDIAYLGELTGSHISNQTFEYAGTFTNKVGGNRNAHDFVFGNHIVADRPVLTRSDTWFINNNSMKKENGGIRRIGLATISAIGDTQNKVSALFQSVGASEVLSNTLASILYPYVNPGTLKSYSLIDINRIYVDSNLVTGSLPNSDNSCHYGAMNFRELPRGLPYVNSLPPGAFIGTAPKYSFNAKHFGYYFDMFNQGKDGKFEKIPGGTLPVEENPFNVNVYTEPAVKVVFVKSELVNSAEQKVYKRKNLQFLLDDENFQSSNLNIFCTSSLPFTDNNTPRNRTYVTNPIVTLTP